MKLKDLFEQQRIIKGDVEIPRKTTTLVGYKHNGIPIAGARVEGDFVCHNTKITSLEGAPSYVGGHFRCYNTNITSLEGAPSYVGGYFSCWNTKITSLEGAPSHVDDSFVCQNTKIRSLEGAPSHVGGSFNCSYTNITSLHHVHKQIKHVKKFVLSNTVKSNIIGVMLIKGLTGIEFDDGNSQQKQVENIINRHLEGDRNVHACQEELIEAGFPEYAKL